MRISPIILTGLFISYLGFAQGPQGASDRVPGQLIVHHHATPGDPALARLFSMHSARVRRSFDKLGFSVIHVTPGTEDAVAQALRSNPLVADVEYDHYAQVAAVPNDPSYSSEWHLAKIQAANAWNMTIGSATPIAIIDSGVDGTHPDLAPRLIAGWNFVSNNSNTADTMGHGTAVAGTVAAATNNGIGVAGVTWANPIMPLVAVDSTGYASYSNMAAAIQYAADNGARVISLSLGGTSPSSALQSAVDYAWNKGAVVVAAAMNNANSALEYPAACTNAIAVSATDENDNLASFSDYGNWITLSAPGTDIMTTQMGGTYGMWQGTSLATPIVSGVAALALAANPGLSAPALVTLLEQNSDQIGGAGYSTSFGWGRVNAYRAVTAALGGSAAPPPPTPQPPPPTPPPPPPPASSGTATFLMTDTWTMGNWRGVYGNNGYAIAGVPPTYPAFATVNQAGDMLWIWNIATSDLRALLTTWSSIHLASTWYAGSSFTIDVNVTDGQTHQIALYCLDWDYDGRAETVSVLNTAGAVLDTRSISGFSSGQYLVWNISGHVTFQVTNNAGPNAVVSGVFF